MRATKINLDTGSRHKMFYRSASTLGCQGHLYPDCTISLVRGVDGNVLQILIAVFLHIRFGSKDYKTIFLAADYSGVEVLVRTKF